MKLHPEGSLVRKNQFPLEQSVGASRGWIFDGSFKLQTVRLLLTQTVHIIIKNGNLVPEKICYPELPETFTSIIIFPIKQCGFVWNCWAQQSTGWSCFSQLKHLKTAILRVVNPTILNADLGSRYTSMKSIHQGIVDSWNELLNGLSRGYNNCKG